MVTDSPETPEPAAPSPNMQAALSRLWVKFLPEIENRLAILERASEELTAGELTDELREQAHAAAHKLAGVLGTFGLKRGTELARQAEELLVDYPPRSAAAELSEWVGGLKILIENRK
jgi:HPt (histidine-containing phosphotransfer) domain-containing protein